ncbi:MAG: alpha/beta fold hydrolase [Methanophagales archaeon ANME-1-THS]|nr:MAG: alpha/beta fold hydrolase [Methanophagales archaeon ANME-1-THS]
MEESVTFYSEHQKLVGNLHLPYEKAPCVLTLHGLESSKDSGKWPTVAARLYAAGYACLRFTFRGCGTGPAKSEGEFEDVSLTGRIRDYQAALEFLHETEKVDMRRLGVMGSSFGGMVAVAAQDKRIKALVIHSTPYTMRHPQHEAGEYYELPSGRRVKKGFYADLRSYNLLNALRTAPPILIIHGSSDELVPQEHARKLYDAAPEPKRLEIVEGADHVFSQPEHLHRVIELSLEWFKRYVV